jgi:S-adenosyl methyltransferase
VFFMGVLGHVHDLGEAPTLVEGLMDRVASGSYLTICDSTHAEENDAFQKAQEDYAETGAVAYRARDREEIASLFDGLEGGRTRVRLGPAVAARPAGRSGGAVRGPGEPIDHFSGMARKP